MREYGPKLVLIFIVSLIIVAIPTFILKSSNKADYSITSDHIQLEAKENGSIEVTETLKVNPHTTITSIKKDLYPISEMENKRYNCYDCIRSVTAHVDGVETTAETFSNDRSEKNARVISFDPTSRNFSVRLSYEIDSRAMKRYVALGAFGLNLRPIETAFNDIEITIRIPESGENKFYIKNTTTGSSVQLKKINKTTYQMNQNQLKVGEQTNFIISFDTKLLDKTNILKEKAGSDVLNFNYDKETRDKLELEKKNKNNLPLIYFIVFSLFVYLFLTILRYRRNHVKRIKDDLVIAHNSVDMNINPPLASKMVSGESKDFSLSLLLELQEKGNIALRADGMIIFLNNHDLNPYQNEFLKVLFQKKELTQGNAIMVPKLIQFLKAHPEKMIEFKQDFGVVRDMATETLYKEKVYDKNLGIFMNAFEKFAFVNLIGAFVFMVLYLFGKMDPARGSIQTPVFILLMISLVVLFIPIDIHTIWKPLHRTYKKTIRIGFALFLVVLAIPIGMYIHTTNEYFLLFLLIFVVINFLLFRFYEEELLTNYGRLEYLRLSGLRQYLLHYREIEVEPFLSNAYYKYYLKYAVAFGVLKEVLPNQTGVLLLLDKQLEELFSN